MQKSRSIALTLATTEGFLPLLWEWSSCFICSQQCSEDCVLVWRLGLCGGSRRAAEHASFRMWFIIGSGVYISSRARAAQRAVHRGKKGRTEQKWLSKMFTFVCMPFFFWRATIWKEGTEMLNYMWQLGNWPCFRIWILRRRWMEPLVGSNEQLSQLVYFV